MLDLLAHLFRNLFRYKRKIKNVWATNIGFVNYMHKACSILLTKELFKPSKQAAYNSKSTTRLKYNDWGMKLHLGSPELQCS